ncbi:MAG: hypothetical protein PHW64_01380 [Sulfuricurvum sp.]|nr:hypothetical protein [Sulfuricurvum sp.]
MLFYNHKHEFIGIDEEGLKLLNYPSLEALLEVCDDVADLFAKEPGYIHNFKSFGWIDFLLHADSDARSAIVHGNKRTFSCTLAVSNLFLCADPAQNGFIVELLHVQTLSGDEIKPHVIPPKRPIEAKPILSVPPVEPVLDILPDYTHITPTALKEPGTLDVPDFHEDEFSSIGAPVEDIHYTADASYYEPEFPATEELPLEEEHPSERPMLGDIYYSNAEKDYLTNLKVDKNYRFDPNVAAHELGLPVDLIEEFIGDFIQQSYEFKAELFESAMKGDLSNLKILSHKLKGVAANLRIEDAFETLSIINSSNEIVEVEANLKYFYTIISKLEGKEIPAEETHFIPETKVQPILSEEEGIIPLEIKEKETIVSEPAIAKEAPLPQDDDIYEFILKERTPSSSPEPVTVETKTDTFIAEPLTPVLPITEPIGAPESAPLKLRLDKVAISGQLGIGIHFFDELIDEYKQDALITAEAIANAISAFDTHTWQEQSSQLKGISDNLRLNEISDELAILSKTNDAQEAHKASKRLNSFLEQL